MNEAELIRRAMSALGKRTSERKKISSRKNAKRPRKKKKEFSGNITLTYKDETTQVLPKPATIAIADVYINPNQFPKA